MVLKSLRYLFNNSPNQIPFFSDIILYVSMDAALGESFPNKFAKVFKTPDHDDTLVRFDTFVFKLFIH